MRNIAILTLLAVTLSVAEAADICLVRDGRPLATIVVPADAGEQLRSAVEVLAGCLQEASGATVLIVDEPDLQAAPTDPLVLVGRTKLWPIRFPEGFDDDGFVIAAAGRAVAICGPNDWGTEFGVYDFLERYVGVRWLMPGEHGTDIPAAKTISIPAGRVEDQPVFFSRLCSGLKGDVQTQWARRNRMHGRVSFHHNLLHLFPVSEYGDTHPEFYPLWRGYNLTDEPGERIIPTSASDEGWQPCLTAPGSVDEAARNIIRFFDENPTATSYSLGMNDSTRFCACPGCLARLSGEKNYLNSLDYSDLYYDWCNQIIERVLKVHPDKWFGCLAYHNVASPPRQVKVHPRLVPYVTYDRMKWIDPEIRSAGEAVTRQWQQAVPTCAWYDYIYGSPYCLPRVYFHQVQKYLTFGTETGVRALYAELYPNWGEGPKPYIQLKLWWNPRQDVDALLAEWYERCVGPEAAPYLGRYYAIWERFWTKDILSSPWFTKQGQYLPFDSATYLGTVRREDILESRRLLDETLARCKTPAQRARAELLEMAFQYYEASALTYLSHTATATEIDTEAQALAAIESGIEGMTATARRLHLALKVFPDDPVLAHPLALGRFPAVRGEDWGSGGLWSVADWVAKGDNAVHRRIAELAAGSETALVREQAALLLAVVGGKTEIVSPNHSFEEGSGDGATGWMFWRKPDTGEAPPIGTMKRSTDVAHHGEYSVLCDGMLRGAPVMTADFPGPGRYAAVAWVYVPPGQQSMGTVELTLAPNGSRSAGAGALMRLVPGKWTLMAAEATVPARLRGRDVESITIMPIINGFDSDAGKVYFDEVALHRLPDDK